MLIYYFNDAFPLYRFSQYNSHQVKDFDDYKVSLNIDSLNKEIHIDDSKNIFLIRDISIEALIANIKNKSGYDLLNYLLSIYPALIFSKNEINISDDEVKELFSEKLSENDEKDLKNLLNFKFDMVFLKEELERLNGLHDFDVDFELVYRDLLLSMYRYCFVLFSKSIDFRYITTLFGKNYELDFVADFKYLEKELSKNIKILNNENIKTRDFVTSSSFLTNVVSSSIVNTPQEVLKVLGDILAYNNRKDAQGNIYRSFKKNIRYAKDLSKKKKTFNKKLENLFFDTIRPLFYAKDGKGLDRIKLKDIQNKLK